MQSTTINYSSYKHDFSISFRDTQKLGRNGPGQQAHPLLSNLCLEKWLFDFTRARAVSIPAQIYKTQKLFILGLCDVVCDFLFDCLEHKALPLRLPIFIPCWNRDVSVWWWDSSCENVIAYAFQLIQGRLAYGGKRPSNGTEWLMATDQSIVRTDHCIQWN